MVRAFIICFFKIILTFCIHVTDLNQSTSYQSIHQYYIICSSMIPAHSSRNDIQILAAEARLQELEHELRTPVQAKGNERVGSPRS